MKLYSRYIFYKTIVGFTACISILISLIWFSRAISFVKYITENGIAINQFFYLFILILPWLLLFIIPISTMATILIVYNRLITSNEMAILKNSGLNKFHISKPAIVLALICTLVCLSISFYFMPFANKKLRLSRSDLADNYANLSINPQTFESLKSMTIYIKSRDISNHLFGILLHDSRSKAYSTTITAEFGNIITQNNSALLYMENGTVQKFNYSSKKSEILYFDKYVFNLTENNSSQSKVRWKAKERYLKELTNYEEDASESDIAKYRIELHQRFIYPLLSLIFAIITLAAMLRGSFNRKGNLSNILLAIFLSTLFLILTIWLFHFIESAPKFTFLIYLVFFLSFVAGSYSLKESIHVNKFVKIKK